MEHDSQPEAYYVHVWIRGIHPMLWRRFLVRSDSTLADLHAVLQIGIDWTDFHLHRFRIRKKDYAVPRRGGLGCHDARQIKLGQLHFRMNELGNQALSPLPCGSSPSSVRSIPPAFNFAGSSLFTSTSGHQIPMWPHNECICTDPHNLIG
jgi:Plasmid pRiA4b ORF-3-like protein